MLWKSCSRSTNVAAARHLEGEKETVPGIVDLSSASVRQKLEYGTLMTGDFSPAREAAH